MNHNDLTSLIEEIVRSRLLDMYTSIPAIIKALPTDGGNLLEVDISVKMQFDYGDGELVDRAYTPIKDVPVLYPSAGPFTISFPLSVGDEGLLVFSQRDTKEFLKLGEPATPSNIRMHAMEDAVFIPCLLSDAKRIEIPEDGLTLSAGENSIVISESGITITGVVTIVDDVTMGSDVTLTSGSLTAEAGDLTATAGEVTAKTIALTTHIHTDSQGGATTVPIP